MNKNPKMSDFLPEEILEKILYLLPVKTLIQFTTVSKSWLSLVKSSAFIQSHLATTIDSNHLLLLLSAFSSKTDHHWLHLDTPDFPEHSTLPHPCPLLTPENRQTDLRVFGASNGLVALETNVSGIGTETTPELIWNPSVRKIVTLPPPPPCLDSPEYRGLTQYTSHGFGYDAESDDYKVLRIVSVSNGNSDLSRFTTVVQVYSLAEGAWRTVDGSVVPVDVQAGGPERPDFVNGCLHMLDVRLEVYYDEEEEENVKGGGDVFISRFKLATEEFGEMVIPEALRRDKCSISRYGETLALIKEKFDDEEEEVNCGCDVWVMKEYGVAESWSFMYSIKGVQVTVFGFRRCGEVVLAEMEVDSSDEQTRMVSWDPKSGRAKVFGSERFSYYFMDSFVESLVLLDHPKATAYKIYP
ncbi:F-box protein CPR1-like [Argentina anserina]|uniref:F-box protein CPR1-like n=1 Tax=Argentina anserina TaxID=57926 RepID=UPI0021767D8D|nr:F-box protein CPR1-like [Potentilla anserina]XP_050387646.1 F-box protein CPR1-like [Potentilla anserina]XP_050387647.1 F-box protein CPR1-like [Potentilla anserina]